MEITNGNNTSKSDDLSNIELRRQLSDPRNFSKFGIIVLENFLSKKIAKDTKEYVIEIFRGNYKSGLVPDKVKYSKNSSGEEYIHSVVNGWKSDPKLKSVYQGLHLLSIINRLTGWDKIKLNQDSMFNVLPRSYGTTSFHQDNAYQNWHTSRGGIVTAWIALSVIDSTSGGIEYLLGSHLVNSPLQRLTGDFIGSKDEPYAELIKKFGTDWREKFILFRPELMPGDVVIHHGALWHGSSPNKSDSSRVSLSIHIMDGKAVFSKKDINPFFNRFKLDHTSQMHSSFFPELT